MVAPPSETYVQSCGEVPMSSDMDTVGDSVKFEPLNIEPAMVFFKSTPFVNMAKTSPEQNVPRHSESGVL
jgi:hypothetical protein